MIARLDTLLSHRPEGVSAISRKGLSGLDPDGWLSQILTGFVGSIALSPLMLLPVLVYAYDEHLGFGPDTAGRISSAALMGLALATVLVSFRTKHWSMARVSVFGMAIMLIFTGLTLVFHADPKIFFALTLIAGFGGGLTQAAVAAALARTHRTERAFAIFTCFQFLYPGLGAYFFPRLLDAPGFGFNAMQIGQILLIAAALILAPVIGAFRMQPDLNKLDGARADQTEWRLLLGAPALLSIIGMMIYGASNGAVWAYSEGIGRVAGLDVLAIGDIIAYANVIAGLAALGVIWLGNRFGHFIPLIGGILGQLLSMFVFYAFPNEIGYIAGTLIFTVSWAIVFPYFLTIQSELDHSGTVVAFGQFTNLVGTAFGPSLAAAYVGSKGDFAGAIWISAVMTVMSLAPMVAIPLLARFKPA